MNKYFILILVFFTSYRATSQNLVCKKIASYPEISFAKHFTYQSNFFFQGDTVLLFNQMKAQVFIPGKKPIEYDLTRQFTKDQKKYIGTSYQFLYYFSDNKLVVRNSYHVFLYTFNKGSFTLETYIKLNQKYGKYIYLNKDVLYFYGIYDHYKASEELAAGYSTYNLKTKQETVFTFPFNAISITHLGPNKFIDFSENGYIVCDPLRYRLYTYSYSNKLKDSITLPGNLFKQSDPARFSKVFDSEKMGSQVVNYLDSMRGFLDTLDRVWMVNYIDTATLFVRLTRNSIRPSEKKGQIFYDHLWVKKEDGWHLTQVKDILNFKIDEAINKEDLWPYFFPGSKYYGNGGTLYYVCWGSSSDTWPQTIKQFSGMEAKDKNALNLKVLQFKVN